MIDRRIPRLAREMASGYTSDLRARAQSSGGCAAITVHARTAQPRSCGSRWRISCSSGRRAIASTSPLDDGDAADVGIPARLATGFQSGIYNPLTELWVIRSSDAHTWVEAWIPGIRLDDVRSHAAGSESAVAEPGHETGTVSGCGGDILAAVGGGLRCRAAGVAGGPVRAGRAAGGRPLVRSERVFGVGLGCADDARGRGEWGLRMLLVLALGAWMWFLGPPLVRLVRMRQRVQRVRRGQASMADATLLYERMLHLLKRHGYHKPPWFTPVEFAASISYSPVAVTVQEFTASYNALRFGGRTEVGAPAFDSSGRAGEAGTPPVTPEESRRVEALRASPGCAGAPLAAAGEWQCCRSAVLRDPDACSAGHRLLPRRSRGRSKPRSDLNWLSRIAVVTVVLALAFFFEYASENHWITEPMRVLLGVVCGAAALFFGDRFWRKGQRTYGQALAAAGIAFLFLSAWASFGLYHLVAQSAGFALMVTITAAAGWLALRYDSPAVALLGLGGRIRDASAAGRQQCAWLVLSYALLLDAGAAFASRRRQWRWPEGLALLGTVTLYCTQLPLLAGLRGIPAGLLRAVCEFDISAGVPDGAGMAALAWAGLWGHEFAGMAGVWAIAAGGLVVSDRRDSSAGAAASFAGFWLAYAYCIRRRSTRRAPRCCSPRATWCSWRGRCGGWCRAGSRCGSWMSH